MVYTSTFLQKPTKARPDNNIIRNAKVYNNKRGPGIGVYWGNGNQIYNNITWGNSVGITAAGGNGLVANDTVYNNGVYRYLGN